MTLERHDDLPDSLAELAERLPLTLTKTQACEVLHMSPMTFQRAVNAQELTVIKAGVGRNSRVLVTRRELLRWFAARTHERVTWEQRFRPRKLRVAVGGAG